MAVNAASCTCDTLAPGHGRTWHRYQPRGRKATPAETLVDALDDYQDNYGCTPPVVLADALTVAAVQHCTKPAGSRLVVRVRGQHEPTPGPGEFYLPNSSSSALLSLSLRDGFCCRDYLEVPRSWTA